MLKLEGVFAAIFMQLQPRHRTMPQPLPEAAHQPPHTPPIPLLGRFKPRRIGQQIGYGYLIAIAIGWAGSLIGMTVADYFQGRGIFQLMDAQRQSRLLSQFEQTAGEVQLHGARALALSERPRKQQQELSSLRLSLADIETIRQELELFLSSHPTWVADEPAVLRSLLAEYDRLLNQQTAQILAAVENGKPQSAFPEILSSDVTQQLEQRHTDLLVLIRFAQGQEAEATAFMETAQGFEKFMIVASITLAGCLAGVLAWRTTRAIAIPLERITQVAQKVTNKADYSIRTDIVRDDEIGVLARSLNDLIERVAERTQRLEHTAQAAETQNQELEQTLQTLRRAQLQLVQSEKMSSLGQLVAGIAHEINNPIGFIHGNLTYAQEYSDSLVAVIDELQSVLPQLPERIAAHLEAVDVEFIREDFPKVLQSIRNGTDRINGLVLSLKVFSRLQESHLKQANLNDGLESALLLIGHRLKPQAKRSEIQVVRRYRELPLVECYSSQINQVCMNILNNAVDAIDERWEQDTTDWKPMISVSTEDVGDLVRIAIANNGTAIPPAIQAKVFDPFFTTKPPGRGVGLGMSTSYEIIHQQHRGNLSFISPVSEEVGARFVLEIPKQVSQTAPSNLEVTSKTEH